MAEVILQKLHKVYRPEKGPEVNAVQDLSLDIKPGELMVLVGPSGCGKSTLLRMIAGLEEVDGGTITIGGQVVNHVEPKDRDVAMVFQNYALFPHMTVWENMAFSLKFRRVAKDEIKQRVMEAARWLHLEEVLERKPKALSGGQRQRTALGRALVRHPKVFLLDEPLSNLDARLRAEMRAEIAKLHARLRTTMIYVTHDQAEAMTLGERLCVMNQGRVLQVGMPLEVYQRPKNLFVASFIGSPGMNLLRGKLSEAAGSPIFSEQPFRDGAVNIALPAGRFDPVKLSGKEVFLGLRSEDIELHPVSETTGANCNVIGKVEICEPMGHETLVHLRVGPQALIARTNSRAAFALGQTVNVHFRLERACLFDAHSEEALT